jgi:hypothetical protein
LEKTVSAAPFSSMRGTKNDTAATPKRIPNLSAKTSMNSFWKKLSVTSRACSISPLPPSELNSSW